ncbi:hypothetical protein NKJ06_24440 [Mesorhizobium sp. M0293]|uniref:hypothetical protein n=1 Tax=Mesorhizobium sp. M0293 TaxID=2956930 RepID=UPI00333C01D8
MIHAENERSTACTLRGDAYAFTYQPGRGQIHPQVARPITDQSPGIKWASAVGWGGQRLYVVPSLELVVVVMAGLYDNPVLQPVVGEVILRRYALSAVSNG